MPQPNDSYTRILTVWQAAVDAAERHLKIAAQLQRDALQGMAAARTEGDAPRDWLRALEMGVTIERAAHTELLTLHRNKPRQR